MKWFRYIRGLSIGVALVVAPLMGSGFGSVRQTLLTVLFVALGTALVILVAWLAIRDFRRYRAAPSRVLVDDRPPLPGPNRSNEKEVAVRSMLAGEG